MASRKEPFVKNEVYHCYNRGVDKRIIFNDANDFSYFLKSLYYLNDIDNDSRIRERELFDLEQIEKKYVEVLAYCLNPNHFHLLLTPTDDETVSKYMQKVLTSYTMYFNQKYSRSGALFQGKFKSRHVGTDEYFQHLLVYVALNNFVHNISDKSKFCSNYVSLADKKFNRLCNPEIVFCRTEIPDTFAKFAKERLPIIMEHKELESELKDSVYIEN